MTDFAMIAGTDQWLRMSHENTSLDVEDQSVQLAFQADGQSDTQETNSAEDEVVNTEPAGIAFDPWCRLYRSDPENAIVQRWHWQDRFKLSRPYNLFAPESAQYGEFQGEETNKALSKPQDIAIDNKGNLFIADSQNQRIVIFNLLDNTLVRSVAATGLVVSLSVLGNRVFALVLSSTSTGNKLPHIISFDAHSIVSNLDIVPARDVVSGPSVVSGHSVVPSIDSAASERPSCDRVCVNQDERIFVLCNAYTADAFVWAIDGKSLPIVVPFASAILCLDGHTLVVARHANNSFLRYQVTTNRVAQLSSLQAPYYDGRGIAKDPFGRVAYFSLKAGVSTATAVEKQLRGGLLNAVNMRNSYKTSGKVVSYRLDNQQMQRKWGRCFIDACLPKGTHLKLGFIVSDSSEFPAAISATAPENLAEFEILRPDLNPPLPNHAALANVRVEQRLHLRSQHRELPWSFTENNWRTYEAPVNAPPGRYLWLVIHLFGKYSYTPKIKSVRVEYPAIDMLRRLPRVFSEQGAASDFLHRYLSLANSNFDELDKRAFAREVLLDPTAAPLQMLPWIGDLLGMEIDKRWPEAAKREILRQAMWLFKYRGTVPGIKRFIEIYVQRDVVLIEHYQVRGLGGAFVGNSEELTSSTVLGAGFRIGGQIGKVEGVSPSDYQSETVQNGNVLDVESGENVSYVDAISKSAHRFSIIIPLQLSAEQRSVIQHILDIHRPVHTLVEICDMDAGMRIGTGLHLGMSSVVGKSSGFGQLQLGDSILGTTDTLGSAPSGMTLGNSKAGIDMRVG